MVIYNGMEKQPERLEQKLSEAFEVKTDDPELELTVTILNINSGMNEELKSRCPVLKEYMLYVEKVRENRRSMPLEDAVRKAIDYCIGNGILRDFLSRQRAEVYKMSIYEYDEERELRLIRRDEREIGRQEERQNSERMLEEEQVHTVQSIISLCKEFGAGKEKAVEKLIDRYHLSKEQAEEKIDLYWECV